MYALLNGTSYTTWGYPLKDGGNVVGSKPEGIEYLHGTGRASFRGKLNSLMLLRVNYVYTEKFG